MGTKRKVSGRTAPAKSSSGWDERRDKMGPITTFEDVADFEDDFHLQRDKLALDDGPDTKRRKYEEEASDEEILGYGSDSESGDDVDEEEHIEEEEEAQERWGTSKKDYYNADVIETEADAEEELAEARRLQKKRLAKYTPADYGFEDEEFEWLDATTTTKDSDSKPGVVTEVLNDVEITADMDPEERMTIIRTRYPEFEPLADELVKLQPLLHELIAQVQAEGPGNKDGSNKSRTVIKCRALAAYLASVAMYFALLQSPAETGGTQLLPADEVHDHPVMESIAKCRDLWEKVKDLKQSKRVPVSAVEPVPETKISKSNHAPTKPKKTKKQKALEAAASEATTIQEQQIKQADKELESLSALIPKSRKSSSKKSEPIAFRDEEDNSDFGEEANISAKAATDKAKKKKSLQFYTSHITQKANKRAAAGRDVGGDMDVPHRERLRDRQIRLNTEAEVRGKKLDEYGRGAGQDTELGGQSDDEDAAQATQVRDEEDDYYNLVSQTAKKRKQDKADKYDAIKKAKAENGLVRVIEGEVGEDGKRAIGRVIEKNKGLAPKRSKDVRNPRVKKRKKFEEKMKKLGSTRAVYKGGEERGGYGGEKTGIKTGLVKSIKL